jgi:tRNA U34 5-methylaminomethyl-2-thiouridine-forming methyltransferase MnmC
MFHTEIKITGDGSATLYVPDLDEHYHSTFGAVQESMHIFIAHGLWCVNIPEIRILEIGFGTGLNALLSLIHHKKEISVTYHSIERNPLLWEDINKLKYPSFLKLDDTMTSLFRKMHSEPWNIDIQLGHNFTIHKINTDLLEYSPEKGYDLVYFDAFAPDVQPEMWHQSVFDRLAMALNPGGILVTYCAKGEVRRKLQHAGFRVVKLPGPPGKREILQAIR